MGRELLTTEAWQWFSGRGEEVWSAFHTHSDGEKKGDEKGKKASNKAEQGNNTI